jgi:hypothetical protein
MDMFTKMVLLTAALAVFMAVPAFADKDCATGDFVGTYTRTTPTNDPINHTTPNFVFQLTLHADGTATQYWTGLPDFQTNLGTGSINIGAWKCRENGNLLVTLLSATYEPVVDNQYPGVTPDVQLFTHSKTTSVFTITNNNTLTRLKAITRTYLPNEDPASSDPNVGHLGNLNTDPIVYKRLVASAADLP